MGIRENETKQKASAFYDLRLNQCPARNNIRQWYTRASPWNLKPAHMSRVQHVALPEARARFLRLSHQGRQTLVHKSNRHAHGPNHRCLIARSRKKLGGP